MTAAVALALVLYLLIWWATFTITGDRLDCRPGATSFCALRTATGAGVSIQWDQGQRVTLWKWGPGGADNRRVWPVE